MRITVTGSEGRVGREVVRQLHALGHEVTGVDIRAAAPGGPGAWRFIRTDLLDAQTAVDAVSDADVVVHLAAFMSWDPKDAGRLFTANVQASFTLLDAVRSTGGASLVVASSGEVYPEGAPQYLPIDERHPREPRSAYGMTKLLLEDMTWFFARAYGIQATVIRLPHTQDAAELLDPASPFSGPRFFLRSKIAQQRAFGNDKVAGLLSEFDDGSEQLLLSRGADGEPYRMPIADTRDTAAGIVAAVTRREARGQTIALGPDAATDFATALPLMSEITGLRVVDLRLPGPAVSYAVDISLARQLLGFTPRHDFGSMLREAGQAYYSRLAASGEATHERSTS
jgi:UDP-glucose 4-epimerase